MAVKIEIAPVQGHTDAAWRHFHRKTYGGDHTYYTPFIRLEHGEFRQRDLRDFTSPLNEGMDIVPQVIFKNMAELEPLLAGLADAGTRRVDLNSGCPFPLQTAKGRGAALVDNVEEFAKLPAVIAKYPDITFSLKMRLGYDDPDAWRKVMGTLNSMPLCHVTLHPRVARQQYGGELYLDRFADFLKESVNPVVFNGELRTPSDIVEVEKRFPDIAGVMTARGVLARPSLAAEYESGREWTPEERIRKMLLFHRELLSHYEGTLCGDAQILSKIKPFWEYAEEEIGRKPWKQIKKASNMAKYHSAVALIQS